MADEDTGQERTEEATPRRLERAREEGQVPRSRELNTAMILLAGSTGLIIYGRDLADRLLGIARAAFQLDRVSIYDPHFMARLIRWASGEALLVLAPIFMLLLVAALASPAALGGWLFSTKAVMPSLQRLDPLAGLQRMFSARALVELLKAIAKVLVVVAIAGLLLMKLRGDLLAIAAEPIAAAMHHSLMILGWSALALSASTLLIAAVDVPFQMFDHAKKLRMTTQQVRDEMKETEGRPEIKNRIRQMQRQIARSRMMSAVPKADVVITNPSHYAVALRYDVTNASAPVLVAKGADLVALKIREIATTHGVPVVRSPKLARAIFYSTELEHEIPSGLYLAVAQVLAYVFHLNNYRKGYGNAPVLGTELPIPEDLAVPAADDEE